MADIRAYNNYYPFGMLQPERHWSTEDYRYGFNGKEMDNEMREEPTTGTRGTGNHYDYGFRVYDPRIGKFLSVDPLASSYPHWSPYPFAMGRPIDGIDLDGLEYMDPDVARIEVYNGRARLKLKNFTEVWRGQFNKAFPYHALDEYIGTPGILAPNPKDQYVIGDEATLELYSNQFNADAPLKQSVARVQGAKQLETPPGGLTSGKAKGIGAVNIINWGLNAVITGNVAYDNLMLQDSRQAFVSAYNDVMEYRTYSNYTAIDDKYMNAADLSQIINVVLQGETTSGNQVLYQIGLKVLQWVSARRGVEIERPVKEYFVAEDGTITKTYYTLEEMIDPALGGNAAPKWVSELDLKEESATVQEGVEKAMEGVRSLFPRSSE